ncbi:MAG TPA: hypothetical protein VMN36_10785 [Verrucomicrobiales bacterium]|nr:hypothetical protein [Verrucomicrobiales bacterium]
MKRPLLPPTLLASLATLFLCFAVAAAPRALPEGNLPADNRLGALRTLDDYHPFHPIDSVDAWNRRAADLRRQTLVANGLWPMPARGPLEPVIHGKIAREGYSVEKVYFQSLPGHFVTGSLYRPEPGSSRDNPRRPAVLSPHGHWGGGRFHAFSDEELRRELETGAELFERGGRHPLQARCVQLARMGCVVFHYDMIGYADSVQIEHRPGVRDEMNTREDWGYFSPAAELHLQNMMGLQTWNSIRALDFLLSLPDVDPERIGVTGASGGGTQTFILGAVDGRPSALFPAVMVSTAMQGGCTCENAPYLRIGAGNIDLAALAAPRPLGLTGADDWTKEIETKGAPDLQNLYAMLGHPGRFRAAPFLQFGHNYNAVSRQAMCSWFNQHLGLGRPEPVQESDYQPLSPEELSVWTNEHPKPSEDQIGAGHERAVLRWFTEDARRQIHASVPNQEDGLDAFREVTGGGWDVILGRSAGQSGDLSFDLVEKHPRDAHILMTGLISNSHGEQLPALFLFPGERWNQRVTLWIDLRGKSSILTENDAPIDGVQQLLDRGDAVMSVDLLSTGEFLADGESAGNARIQGYGNEQEAWQKFAGYTFGYNPPLFCRRVHDVLSAVDFVRTHPDWKTARVDLVGVHGAGPIVLAARSRCGDAVDRTAVDSGGFRFASLQRFDDPFFVPGSVKYLDLPGLAALCAPADLLLLGEEDSGMDLVQRSYRASGRPDALRVEAAPAGNSAGRIAEWLSRP